MQTSTFSDPMYLTRIPAAASLFGPLHAFPGFISVVATWSPGLMLADRSQH
ncbi:hypothetical protein [Massilia scottii]|uniref:hypothetical protein n=1 Tax=Massilia scottii TaxID=3057166 RepID=UPI0027963FCA|nr:hypothetical protein [Massilia sp. CCM 9029]MDQ1833877.1 hypothetical protein [Massilia sp. CCM 9029]